MKGLIYFSVLICALIGHCQPALISVLRLHREDRREEPAPAIYQPSPMELQRWLQAFYDQVWENQCGDNCAQEGPRMVTEKMIRDYETQLRYLQFRRRQPDLARLLDI